MDVEGVRVGANRTLDTTRMMQVSTRAVQCAVECCLEVHCVITSRECLYFVLG